MKLLILTLIISFSSFSSSTRKNSIKKSSSSDDKKLVVSKAKRKEIDDSIKESEALQSCKDKADEDTINKCIQEKIASFTPEQLDAIAEDLGSSAYQVSGSVKSEAIKNFMKERIQKFIYGDKKRTKKEPTKVVGHDIYRDIYKNQLGKNMLLDVNTYCLENMGFKEPTQVLHAFSPVGSGKTVVNKDGEEVEIPLEKHGLKILSGFYFDGKDALPPDSLYPAYIEGSSDNPSKIKWLEDFNEYADGGSKEKRSAKQLEDLKKFYLSPSEIYPKKSNAQIMNKFCQEYVIETACVAYKCYNTVDTDKLSELETEQCKMIPDYPANKTKTKLRSKGRLACNLKTRLEAYKKTFTAIKDQENALSKVQGKTIGFEGDNKNQVIESVDKDFSDIDRVTSISSRDLTNNVDELKNAKENAEKLKEDCQEESEECLAIADRLDDDDKQQLGLQDKIATAAYKARLEQMKGSSDEEFEEFLQENGLLDKYGKKLEDENFTKEDLVKLIVNDYDNKKKALTESMFEKYKKLDSSPGDGASDEYSKSIDNAVKELEEDKDYVETIFEYNNIVSSYITLTDEEGNSAGSLASMRESELSDIQKYAEGDKDQETYEKYESLFQDEEASSGASKDKSVDFTSFLDNILDD